MFGGVGLAVAHNLASRLVASDRLVLFTLLVGKALWTACQPFVCVYIY